MRNKDSHNELLAYFESAAVKDLQLDETKIANEYNIEEDTQSLPIKILSAVGGFMACLAFLGFMGIAGLHESETALLVFGFLFIAAAIWTNLSYDKIIIDTISVTCFMIGYAFIGFGLFQMEMDVSAVSFIFILIAIVSVSIVQNYVLSFISILIINGSIYAILESESSFEFIYIYFSIVGIVLTAVFMAEAKMITSGKILNKLYKPLRIGMVLTLIVAMLYTNLMHMRPNNLYWLAPIVFCLAIIYLIFQIFGILKITKVEYRIGIVVFCILLLLPTAMSPGISAALLIMLLSFMVNYKTGFAIGILAFIYFVAMFYYDLNFTLLTKSLFLFLSGILFIGLYLFTSKKLQVHE